MLFWLIFFHCKMSCEPRYDRGAWPSAMLRICVAGGCFVPEFADISGGTEGNRTPAGGCFVPEFLSWRHEPDSNRCMTVLQTVVLTASPSCQESEIRDPVHLIPIAIGKDATGTNSCVTSSPPCHFPSLKFNRICA